MCFYLRNWQVTFLLYTLGVFISEYTAKAFTEPRDYRVVFLIQENSGRFLHRYQYIKNYSVFLLFTIATTAKIALIKHHPAQIFKSV